MKPRDSDLIRRHCFEVAAVIVCWNSSPVLGRCLGSIRKQTVPFSRIVIIDNASSDVAESKAIALEYGAIFLQLSVNTGFAAANNLGVSLVPECDAVALINPDAFLAADWLDMMQSAWQRWPEAGSFASVLLLDGDPTKYDGVGDVYHLSGLVWRAGHGEKVNAALESEREVFSACAAAALYRRRAFEMVGGFDERFFCYIEDVDLGFRLQLAGYSCRLVTGAKARHVGSLSSGGQHSDFAVFHGHRNLVWCYVKCMPLLLLLILSPAHLALNLISLLVFSVRGQAKVIMRAKLCALQGLPAVWRSRALIQSQRRIGTAVVWRLLDKKLPGLWRK